MARALARDRVMFSWHFRMNQHHYSVNATAVSILNDIMELYLLQCDTK